MTDLVNLLDVVTEGRELPKGCDAWSIRSVYPDLRSSRGFRWPFPGNWAEASGPIVTDNHDSCPSRVGDGICVATTWQGMASGNIPASVLLLTAYNLSDLLGNSDSGKIRVSRAYVVDLIDGARLVREYGERANLRDANLRDANLRDANLRDANLWDARLQYASLQYASLQGASLQGASLQGASLQGASLQGASLQGANLRDANLRDANLRDANLQGARLQYANLWDANLWDANLWDANLQGANLQGANLQGANLQGANLQGANLQGANLPGSIN